MDALTPKTEIVVPPVAPSAAINPLTLRLLQAPIVPLILKLSWPNMLIMLAQAGAALVDTWWLAKLGNDALAGMVLVFPFVLLVGTVSGGSIGAGISAAVARALGARQHEQADAVLMHGLIINVVIGGSYAAVMLIFGRSIYQATGGRGGELEAALIYSNVLFAGNTLFWIMNALMSVIRGTGNMFVPALVSCGGVVLMLPLSPCLIFGLGPFPALGIAGSAISLLVTYVVGTIVLVWYILSGRCVVKFKRTTLRWQTFVAILSIGAAGTIVSLLINLTASVNNALVSSLGRRRRSRRLRHRRAARIPADPARLRPRRAAGRHGRHQHRRRQSPARAEDRADRRRGGLWRHGDDRRPGRAVPRRLAQTVHAGCDGDQGRQRLPADRRPRVRLLRPRHRHVFRAARRQPAALADRRRGAAQRARDVPAARSPRFISARCMQCSSCLRWRWSCRARFRCSVCGRRIGCSDLRWPISSS